MFNVELLLVGMEPQEENGRTSFYRSVCLGQLQISNISI